MIAFVEKGHKYTSVSKDLKGVNWISATKFVSFFHKHFDEMLAAIKASQNPKSKWFGVPPERQLEIWAEERDRSTYTGSLYHADMEKRYLSMKTIPVHGQELPVYHPEHDKKGRKISPDQHFGYGIYPEAMMWLRLTDGLGICGQSDIVAITMDNPTVADSALVASVGDHKTNKKIEANSYVRRDGSSDKMFWPFHNMDDCNLNHYTIQMNFYLYIILKNNPSYKPGSLVLRHVEFEVESENEWGYPIHKIVDGLPVVTNVTKYNIPVLPMDQMEKAINILIEEYA